MNGSAVSIVLSRTLEDLVDSDTPHNVLKFRLVCDYDDGDDTVSLDDVRKGSRKPKAP